MFDQTSVQLDLDRQGLVHDEETTRTQPRPQPAIATGMATAVATTITTKSGCSSVASIERAVSTELQYLVTSKNNR